MVGSKGGGRRKAPTARSFRAMPSCSRCLQCAVWSTGCFPSTIQSLHAPAPLPPPHPLPSPVCQLHLSLGREGGAPRVANHHSTLQACTGGRGGGVESGVYAHVHGTACLCTRVDGRITQATHARGVVLTQGPTAGCGSAAQQLLVMPRAGRRASPSTYCALQPVMKEDGDGLSHTAKEGMVSCLARVQRHQAHGAWHGLCPLQGAAADSAHFEWEWYQ